LGGGPGGRCARAAGKARKRQRIEALEARPHHPELKGAYALLVDAKHAQSHTFHWLP
jgi:hypothetical protein